MPHIHTDPGQHDHTASAYIFRTDTVEPTVMLHQHKLLHKYLQFGGHVELHENPWAALTHEIREESGYDLAQLQLLQPPYPLLTHQDKRGTIVHPTPFSIMTYPFADQDHYHTDLGYAFVTGQHPAHAVADGESNHIKLLTKSEVLALPEHKLPENARSNILYAFAHVIDHWRTVDPTRYGT